MAHFTDTFDADVKGTLVTGRLTVGGTYDWSQSNYVELRSLEDQGTLTLGKVSDPAYSARVAPGVYEIHAVRAYATDVQQADTGIRNADVKLGCVVVGAP